IDREAAIDQEEPVYDSGSDAEPDPELQIKRKRKKGKSPLETWDQDFLTYFIATTKCRRIPWNIFFSNESKMSLFTAPPGSRCCDNCQPEDFPVEVVTLEMPYPTRIGRSAKPSEDLQDAISAALRAWRSQTIDRDYPGQRMVTSRKILSDDVIRKIVERPSAVSQHGTEVFYHIIPWQWGVFKYGTEVVDIVRHQVSLFPDPNQVAREEQERERAYQRLLEAARKQERTQLVSFFEECWDEMYNLESGETIIVGRGKNK
ncbi:hypothetical protein K435DRAFT_573818, partial [Dendrothele bispora CBS 962.96]